MAAFFNSANSFEKFRNLKNRAIDMIIFYSCWIPCLIWSYFYFSMLVFKLSLFFQQESILRSEKVKSLVKSTNSAISATHYYYKHNIKLITSNYIMSSSRIRVVICCAHIGFSLQIHEIAGRLNVLLYTFFHTEYRV